MENIPFVYKTTPFLHQRNEFESTRDYQYFAYFWEMGLGKSKIVIDTIQWLFLKDKIDSVVITAEKGYYLNWIIDEFPKHWPDIPIRITAFNAAARVEERKKLMKLKTPVPGVLDVILVNIESLSHDKGNGYTYTKDFIMEHKSTMMVIDESTTIKSPKASRTKNTIKLGRMCTYRRILTGTPITQSPIDLYSQCEFLKQGLLGFASYTSFRNFYTIMQPIHCGSRMFNQVVGFREMDDLAERIQPFSSRLLKADHLDLPEKVYSSVYVEPTPQQQALLVGLKNEAMLMTRCGEITVQNALSLLTKSLQLAGGHIKTDDEQTMFVDSNKAQALVDLINTIPDNKKIIVWGYFHADMEVIQKALTDVCPVFEMSGRIEGDDRTEAVQNFKRFPGKCVFLASPRVAGKSLTLNEAEYVIYYSNGFNLEHRLQSEDRNHRIGQTCTVNYYDLICIGTPDSKVVKALKNKEIISRSVLDNISSYFDFTSQLSPLDYLNE